MHSRNFLARSILPLYLSRARALSLLYKALFSLSILQQHTRNGRACNRRVWFLVASFGFCKLSISSYVGSSAGRTNSKTTFITLSTRKSADDQLEYKSNILCTTYRNTQIYNDWGLVAQDVPFDGHGPVRKQLFCPTPPRA